jgi:hypothetical protein
MTIGARAPVHPMRRGIGESAAPGDGGARFVLR